MIRTKTFLAKILPLFFVASLLVLPKAEALPHPFPGDIYIFAGDESGGRYAVKSNGDGTFGPVALTFTKGDNNRGGATEDFDKDGDLDFVGCNDDTNNCYLFKQGPVGTFVDQGDVILAIALNGVEMAMASEDFNQDGNMDIVVSGLNTFFRILFGNGAGGFTQSASINAPPFSSFRGKDADDVTRDGYPDVVAALGTNGQVYLFTNNGAGGFPTNTLLFDTLGDSNDPHAVAVADFNGDRNLDIAAGGSLDGDVSLWTGDGNGVFTFSGQIFDFNGRTSIGNYDFDNDGDQDLIAVTQSDLKVRYLSGNGNGTFATPVEIGTIASSGVGIATPPAPPILPEIKGRVQKDLDGNGVPDATPIGIELVALSLTGTDALGRPVSQTTVTAADGSYSFRVPRSSAAGYTLSVTTPVAGLATTAETRAVSVPLAGSILTEHFLYLPFSTVQGTIFDDRDGDGVQNDGAGGWTATTLALTGTDYRGTAVSRTVMTTDTTGAFTIGGLLPSNAAGYSLAVMTAPPGASATTPVSATLSIPLGETTVTRNVGYVGDSLIEGTFFLDEDGDGLNDDDPGGWLALNPDQLYSLRLTGTDFQGAAIDRTTTGAANGAYSIGALKLSNAAGYTLAVTSTPPSELNNPTTTTTRTIVINHGSSLLTHDFGYRLLCTDGDNDTFKAQGGLCGAKDCNDASAAVNPAAAEVCNAIDDNCDGVIDESFPDADGDGVTTCAGDCNDTNAAIKPGATEVCNSFDDDCDAAIDEGFDGDNDGVTSCAGDCNDGNAAIKPGATEVCNLRDDDCNSFIDEGFDADGDAYTTCAGDCNDTIATGQEGFLTVNIESFSNAGPGADMTDSIFVGDGAAPFGAGSVTIPLSANHAAITDPVSSSPDVPGLHILRGKDAVKGPFIRITAYGHNAQESREVVTANIALAGAHVTSIENGPTQPYEGQGNGSCEAGKPGKDEYAIPLQGTTGTLCSTTNVSSDTVTIHYALENAVACNEIVNPAIQCSDPAFLGCGACIHPGAPDPFTDGVDSDCDSLAECTEKKDYAAGIKCEGTTTVTSDATLDAYIAAFGLVNGKYQHLKIDYNVARSVAIHTPCRITVKHGRTITGGAICLDGRKGVRTEGSNTLTAPRTALLSEQRGVRVGAQSTIDATIEMVIQAFRRVRVGVDALLKGGTIRIISEESEHAVSSVGARATITASTLSLTAEKKAKIGPHAKVTVTGDFFMNAPRCSIAHSALITAGTKSGSCFAVPAAPAQESDREEQEEGKKDERDVKDEEE